MNKRLIYWGLALLAGILPALAWPPNHFPVLLFFAFVPLFQLETYFTEKGRGKWFGWYTYFGLFVFNLLTTWWVYNASPGGAIFMLFANSFLMLLPFLFYRFAKRLIGLNKALILFAVAWLSFEYTHYRWDLAYPWLTLGNSFATSTSIIQWYEYTGVLGGSLWIIVSNIIVFRLITNYSKRLTYSIGVWIIAPIIWSVYLGSQISDSNCSEKEVLLIQPNIDPYEKFKPGKSDEHLSTFLDLMDSGITENTRLIVLPETALVGNTNENYLAGNYDVRKLQMFLKKHPRVGILVGASTHRFYEEGEKLPTYPRYYEPEDKYYDSYNTAVKLDQDLAPETYHKSKLVPGVESLPFPQFFKYFDAALKLDFGGVSGNLGKDKEAKTFYYTLSANDSFTDNLNVAPLICYESVFGEYVGDFTRKGANLFAVITNDGWWKNTPGHKQHMHYARLRAIEYRRYVVRSANTGISCIINDNGEVLDELGWWKQGYVRGNIQSLNYKTFYAKSGDYIGKLAMFIFIFLGLSIVVKWRVQKSNL